MTWPTLIQMKLLFVGEYPHGAIGGLTANVSLAAITLCISFAIGLVVGLGRLSSHRYIRCLCRSYVELIRATPLLIVVFWFYFLIPNVLGFNISIFKTAIIAFSVYAGAYLAEVVRAGILALPKGQTEAGYAIGLSHIQVLAYIILPQALKLMIPTFISNFIALFKETPVLFVIGIFEIVNAGMAIANLHLDQMVSTFMVVAAIFFIICFIISRLSLRLEKKLSPERHIETIELEEI